MRLAHPFSVSDHCLSPRPLVFTSLVAPPSLMSALSNRPAWPAEGQPRRVREVWAWNFQQEFSAFSYAALQPSLGGGSSVLALDTEFPGFLRESPWNRTGAATYQALRENVDLLWPIQIGVAVTSSDGTVRGVWSFNMRFDMDNDLHNEKSVAFLRTAGIDFARHRVEGIQAAELGQRLSTSALVGPHSPCWITFSGLYDLGYLMKLLTIGRPLPVDMRSFESMISMYIPRRCDLRDLFPAGSLESLGEKHGVRRYGAAHTAGSDALLTLELFLLAMSRFAQEEKTWESNSWTPWAAGQPWGSYSAPVSWNSDAWSDWQYISADNFPRTSYAQAVPPTPSPL